MLRRTSEARIGMEFLSRMNNACKGSVGRTPSHLLAREEVKEVGKDQIVWSLVSHSWE